MPVPPGACRSRTRRQVHRWSRCPARRIRCTPSSPLHRSRAPRSRRRYRAGHRDGVGDAGDRLGRVVAVLSRRVHRSSRCPARRARCSPSNPLRRSRAPRSSRVVVAGNGTAIGDARDRLGRVVAVLPIGSVDGPVAQLAVGLYPQQSTTRWRARHSSFRSELATEPTPWTVTFAFVVTGGTRSYRERSA